MYSTAKLTPEEFRSLHNSICELHRIANQLTGNEGPRIHAIIEDMHRALENSYQESDAEFNRRMQQYDELQEASKFNSIWSIYSVTAFNEVPYPQARTLLYENHWGGQEIRVALGAQDWHAIWAAADQAIRLSGDRHHIFIEGIEPDEDDHTVLVLTTGS